MNISLILMIIAVAAVFASLAVGLFAMARGRESDAQLSQKMMRVRVGLQIVAVGIFVLALATNG